MKRGFALIEMIVSTFVLAVVALAVAGAFVSAIKSVTYTKNVIAATALANTKMEMIHNLPYNDLATPDSTFSAIYPLPVHPIPSKETVTSEGISFDVYTIIEFYDDPFDGLARDNADTAPFDYKKVSISVALADKTTKLTTLATNIGAKAAETEPSTGVLMICVIDSHGAPVGGATVTINNSTVTPPVVDRVAFTSVIDGCVMIPNLPHDLHNHYHIVITKDGFSSDWTYSGPANQNPHAMIPDMNVPEQGVATGYFVIDTLAKMNIQFVDAGGNHIQAGSSTTSALMHFNGADNGTVFTDESGKIWTQIGSSIVTKTDVKKFGSASAYGRANPSNGLTSAASDDFNPGSGDFTLDTWFKNEAVGDRPVGSGIFKKEQDANNRYELFLRNNDMACTPSTFKLYFSATVAGSEKAKYETTACAALGTDFHHLALTRSGPNIYIFVDGVSQALTVTTAIGANSIDNTGPETIFYSPSHNHYLDEFRFVKGQAAWTANFTPPTSEYTYSPPSGGAVSFTLSGAKEININPQVLKYQQNFTTNADGYISIPYLEFDSYSFSNLGSYYLINTTPMYPINLAAGADLNVTAVLSTSSTNPAIYSVDVTSGKTGETVSLNIIGGNFHPAATVNLNRIIDGNRVQINGTNTNRPHDYLITTDFNLAGAATGQWNLEVVNPNGEKVDANNIFEVTN